MSTFLFIYTVHYSRIHHFPLKDILMSFTKTVRLSRSTHVVIFVVIALSITACSYIYYQRDILPVRFRKMAELKAFADLKISQIELWRQERLAEVRMNSSGIIRQYVNQWCQDWNDESRKNDITSRLQFFLENEGYQNIILADLEGRIRVSLDSRLTDLETESKILVDKTISLNQPIFGDFFYCQIDGHIHLDVLAPILDENDQPIAVLILRTNPNLNFYSFIQSWPTSWKSAETVLIRIEEDQPLVLNVLSQHPDSPLNLRLLNSNGNLQEILTTCGTSGECAFQDYRGIDVLAEFRAIRDSNWFMIVKVDKQEILAELDYRTKTICTYSVVLILLIGLGTEFLLNYVDKHRLESQYFAERTKQQARAEIQETLIRNISIRIQAEEDLRYANETLEQRILERTSELDKAHAQMVIQEKMVSVGQLAAGIAHELNNPLNFISMNFGMLSEYFEEIVDILQEYRKLASTLKNMNLFLPETRTLHEKEMKVKLDHILEDTPVLLKESNSGFDRITRIIQSMRDFSQVDRTSEFTMFNVNAGIKDTLVIVRNEYRYIADVTTDLGELPDILCLPEQLNHVFLNLVLNSVQAIQTLNRPEKGGITIQTWQDETSVYCDFTDNGPGIPAHIRTRIFDPFFTTKPPGQGTGLGLSTCFDIIVEKHRGSLAVNCPESGGTVFSIRIPKCL